MKSKAIGSAPVAGFITAAVMLVSLMAPVPARAAAPVRLSGQLDGLVTGAAGKPQAGAIVVLLNRQDRFVQQSATDALGSFSFAELLPDLYSIQVSFASFVPAVKERIQIKAGMRSVLDVNLSRVFSSIQLVATTPVPNGLMSDSWKWVLRSNSATRPVLRILPVEAPEPRASGENPAHSMFTDSRGMVKISASDGAPVMGDNQADLGTQFAFATSVYGGNRVQVSGDLGYGIGPAAPSGAFRTTYSHELGDGLSPEISVTMRQFYVPWRLGQGGDGSLPALRTTGVSMADKMQLSDSLLMEYGFEFDNVSYLNHVHYFSPWARMTRTVPHGKVDFTWTSGNARPELGLSSTDPNAGLQRDLASLAALPGVSLAGGRAEVQRGDNYELGVTQRYGSREFRLSAYQESVSNTLLTVASPETGLFPGDLLPNLFSNSASFDMGRFENAGYTAAFTQDLGENYKVTVLYGSIGVISPRTGEIPGESANDLRDILKASHRQAVTLQISGTYKHTGTRFRASYQWTDYQSAMQGPQFSTESTRPEPGLNVMVRQPMPAIPRMPWRMEATAELRNLLAQGYLPLSTAGGDPVLLVNTPRSIRGALAFVF